MPRYIVTATESSVTQPGAPTSQQVQAALVLPARAGRWLGPAPRVTRRNDIGEGRFLTTFAWPIDIRAENEIEYNRAAIGSGLAEESPDWSSVTITPYSDLLNGPESFWTSGDANRTRTRDDWSFVLDRTNPPENPVGPADPAVRNPTLGEHVGAGVGVLTDTAKGIALLALVVGAIYLGVTYLPKVVRKNPRGRRRLKSDDSWLAAGLLFLPP